MSEQEWLNIFGDNLVDMLKDANMTQSELAVAIDVTEATVSRYIHKTRMPSVKALINMSEVFGVSLDDLMYFGDSIY